jgi:hypothetical protein
VLVVTDKREGRIGESGILRIGEFIILEGPADRGFTLGDKNGLSSSSSPKATHERHERKKKIEELIIKLIIILIKLWK